MFRKRTDRGGLNLEQALLIALLVLVAGATLLGLGQAIACAYAKQTVAVGGEVSGVLAGRCGLENPAEYATVDAGVVGYELPTPWNVTYIEISSSDGSFGLDAGFVQPDGSVLWGWDLHDDLRLDVGTYPELLGTYVVEFVYDGMLVETRELEIVGPGEYMLTFENPAEYATVDAGVVGYELPAPDGGPTCIQVNRSDYSFGLDEGIVQPDGSVLWDGIFGPADEIRLDVGTYPELLGTYVVEFVYDGMLVETRELEIVGPGEYMLTFEN